jgi:hypothetical protein
MSASDDFKHANGAPIQPGSAVAVPTPQNQLRKFRPSRHSETSRACALRKPCRRNLFSN